MEEIAQSTLTISVTSGITGTLVIGGAAVITGDINAPLAPIELAGNAPAAEGE